MNSMSFKRVCGTPRLRGTRFKNRLYTTHKQGSEVIRITQKINFSRFINMHLKTTKCFRAYTIDLNQIAVTSL